MLRDTMSDAPNTDKTFEDHNQELLDLVDSNDNVIGQIERAEVSTLEPNTGKFVRCIEAIIMRSNGDVWVPVRSQTKRIAPGGYDYGVAGHVPSGETYERAVILEAQEEAGLVLEEDNAILIEHQLPSESNGPYFSNFYLIRTDSAPALSDEHTSGSWMSLDALAEKLHSGMPAKPSLLSNVERLQEYLKKEEGQ